MGKRDSVIEVGNKLYYEINKNSRMDVPSYFYEKLEKYYDKWISSDNKDTFYVFCKNNIMNN